MGARGHAEVAAEERCDGQPELPDRRRVVTAVKDLMAALELDVGEPHFRGTPERVARMFEEILGGCYTAPPPLRTFPNAPRCTGPIVVRDLAVYSICAHHLLPFLGTVEIAYLPNERLVGLSKLGRAVEYIARRPQVQERLTEQLAEMLDEAIRPKGIVVTVEARHLCMEMRGIRSVGSTTRTAAFRGEYVDPARGSEVLRLLRTHS